MRWLNAERAEGGGGCNAAHVSGEKVDELVASAPSGGKLLKEESGTDGNFAAIDTKRWPIA